MTRQPPRLLQIQTTEEPMSETATAIQPQVKAMERKLAILAGRAQAIAVIDQDSYREACQISLDAKAYVKAVGFELDPGIESAKQTLDILKSQKAKFIDPAKQIIETASSKAEQWRAEEKRKADAEEARLREQARIAAEQKAAEERRAEEARIAEENKKRQKEIEQAKVAGELKAREAERLKKQADADAEAARQLAARQAEETAKAVPEVKVAAAIPRVAGVKNQTYWKFKVVRGFEIPLGYTMPDEVKIGQMVRTVKDKAKAEAECPGIEVWSEG